MSHCIEKRRNELLGLEFTNKHGHRCFIIDYKDAHNVTVMFYDTMSISTMEYGNLKKGSFLDRYKPSLYGVGYLGKSGRTEQNKMAYRAWNHILSRCYNPEVQKKQPYYYDCSVDPRWHCFAVFEEWFIQQEQRHFKEDYGVGRRWSIDKDILVRGNKIYSPETCCLLPAEINKTLITQGYVSRWREKDGKFTFRVFEKIVGYEDHYLEKADNVVDARNERVRSLIDKYRGDLTDESIEALNNYRFMYSLDGKMYRGFYK